MRRRILSGAWALLATSLLTIVTGCGSTHEIILTSSPRLNMCGSNEPHPVFIRIYYLRATSKFETADFNAIWYDERATLEDERIETYERTLNPRQQLPIPIKPGDDAKDAVAIGIVANFCDPGPGGCWKKIVPITGRNQKVRFHLDQGCLSVD